MREIAEEFLESSVKNIVITISAYSTKDASGNFKADDMKFKKKVDAINALMTMFTMWKKL